MSSEEQQMASFQMVRGILFPAVKMFTRKNIEDAMDYPPGDGDLIIGSYPKTGTTWMQYIVLQVKSKGETFPSIDDATFKICPYIEMVGKEAVDAQDKPRFYKHHIAYDKVRKNDRSKCIYVYRHPEDVVVSYYHFTRSFSIQLALDFDEFFERFLTGNVGYGSYFRHVLSFYQHRGDENMLMVSYEKLQAHRKEEVLRVAKFLGEEHYENLVQDGELLSKIIERTSFDYMKKNLVLTHPDIATGVRGKESAEDIPPTINFFRKGIVGDGRTVLTETQRQRMKVAAEEVLKGTSIIKEWYPE